MTITTSREIRLASRPTGVPTTANFTLAETTLKRNESLVAKGFISPSTLDQNRKERN